MSACSGAMMYEIVRNDKFSRHSTSSRVLIMNELVNESSSVSRSIFNATRIGNGFNKVMRTGNGFNKEILYILPSKQK